jgi:hypothetical protein
VMDSVLQWLESNGVGSQAAPNPTLFVGGFPVEGPDDCLTLLESGGMAPENIHDQPAPAYSRPGLQIMSRAKSYKNARDKAWEAYNALVQVQNQAIGSVVFLKIEPRQTPFNIGQDDNSRELFSCNFDVWIEGTPQ